MAGIIPKSFRLHTAYQFQEQFSETNPNRIYIFVGKATPWADDNNPPNPVDTVEEVEYSTWNQMLGLKKINSSDVTFATSRYNWTSGSVYTEYRADNTFHTTQFYVMTDEYQVYKCLYNNKGAASTVKPTGRLTTVFTTADGYKWKFMGEIPASDAIKYVTTNYIPAKVLTANNGSFQWDTQQAAVNGSIETIGVKTGGAGYLTNSGTVVAANATTITLASTANTFNDSYNNSAVYISGGTGAGQVRKIVDYVGATKVATVTPAFSPVPTTSSSYIVSPRVEITSGDGTGLTAYTTVASGAVDSVEVLTKGQNYNFCNLAVTANSGSGATLTAHLSPKGGHGKNMIEELYAHNVMLNVKMTGSESDTLFTNNDFRMIGLVIDPLLTTGAAANGANYMMATKITLTSPVGVFTADETITGSTSKSTASVVEYSNSTVLMVYNVVGTFTTSETITGAVSGATATVSSITVPTVAKYTGKIIYIENRQPVVRSSLQQEDIKVIIKF